MASPRSNEGISQKQVAVADRLILSKLDIAGATQCTHLLGAEHTNRDGQNERRDINQPACASMGRTVSSLGVLQPVW